MSENDVNHFFARIAAEVRTGFQSRSFRILNASGNLSVYNVTFCGCQ
jgi:hypothetical protein